MTNSVVVVAQGINSLGGNIQFGTLNFAPSDITWATGGNPIVGAVESVNIEFNGGLSQFAISLFAMDNAGLSTNWAWKLTGNIESVVIVPRLLTVLFANGPQQNLSDLLQASTLAPS